VPGIESEAHRNLKRLALLWAGEHGYSIYGIEVKLPRSNYRADVAAYLVRQALQPLGGAEIKPTRLVRQPIVGTTAVFECKQSRADFLKDSRSSSKTEEQLGVLHLRRLTLERLIGLHLPSLRKGETLFPEYDALDFSQHEHRTYRKVLRQIEILQARLYGKTKFDRMTRYECANVCYLVVDEGILEPHEAPLHWGLLVRRGNSLVQVCTPAWREIPQPVRLELLHRIALAGTRRLTKEFVVGSAQPQDPMQGAGVVARSTNSVTTRTVLHTSPSNSEGRAQSSVPDRWRAGRFRSR